MQKLYKIFLWTILSAQETHATCDEKINIYGYTLVGSVHHPKHGIATLARNNLTTSLNLSIQQPGTPLQTQSYHPIRATPTILYHIRNPVHKVGGNFPKSQRPTFIYHPALLDYTPTTPSPRWNFIIADWCRFEAPAPRIHPTTFGETCWIRPKS